jgi:hypothetical protein
MYKIMPFTDPASGSEVFLVVNKITGRTEAKFETREEAKAYILSK